MMTTKAPIESPTHERPGATPDKVARLAADTPLGSASLEEIYAEVLHRIGEDPARDGLLRTPERMAKSMQF